MTIQRKELTASTEIIDLMGEQSRKIEELRGLLRHIIRSGYGPADCEHCKQIAKEIGQ